MSVFIYSVHTRIKVFFYNVIKKITKKKMIIDVTGTILMPGNDGKDCYGNGEHFDRRGNIIECCCDECDYKICCSKEHSADECKNCTNSECPRVKKT